MVFELASTNRVIELGIILLVLLGWQFMAAEYLGDILMVIVLAVIFRLTLSPLILGIAGGLLFILLLGVSIEQQSKIGYAELLGLVLAALGTLFEVAYLLPILRNVGIRTDNNY